MSRNAKKDDTAREVCGRVKSARCHILAEGELFTGRSDSDLIPRSKSCTKGPVQGAFWQEFAGSHPDARGRDEVFCRAAHFLSQSASRIGAGTHFDAETRRFIAAASPRTA